MANTSEDLIHSMLVPSFQWNFQVCIKEKVFGMMLFYFIMALCFFLGTAAHSWCLCFYFSGDWKNKQIQIFLLHYIIMELILCIQCSIEILNVFFFNNNVLFWMGLFIFGLSWAGRPLMQVCICFEQYLAVIHPVTFLKYKGIKYRSAVVAVAWMMAFGCGLYYTIGSYYYYFSVFVFFIALSVIFFCYVSVLCALKHPGPGEQTGREVGNQQKKNAFQIILSILIIILLTYLPQIFLLIFSVIKIDQTLLECNIIPIVMSVNVCSVLIMPLMKMYKEGCLKCVRK